MIEHARRLHPGLRFEVASATALDVPPASLGGVLGWWSLFNLPRDVLPLAEHLLRFFARQTGKPVTGFSDPAREALARYPWPGNVRELQNEIAKAALLLEPGEPLDLHHLSPRVRQEPAAPHSLTLEETVRQAEREAFTVALAATEGDAQRAMELLGVSRTTYYRKLKELGLG